MAKMTRQEIATIRQRISEQMAAATKAAINTEATFTVQQRGLTVYTENLGEADQIIEFLSTLAPFAGRSDYEAEEDMPAACCLFFDIYGTGWQVEERSG